MSVVYWRLSCDFHSWAQGYSLRCGKQNHWCLSVCFEDCTNFQVSSWSYLEIDRNCLLCALCLWSGGGVCLWLPSCQGNTSGQEAVAGAGCTWWQTIAQGAGRMFPPGSILGRWKVAMLTMLLAKYEAILRILMQEECAVLHFEWPAVPCPWSFHVRKTTFLLVRSCCSAFQPPPTGVTVAAVAFVWSPRRVSVNKWLSLTQDWRNGLFLLFQPDCLWNASEVSGGYDGQGAMWYPVFWISCSLAHWPQQLVVVLPCRNNFCIFLSFLYFLKTASPLIVFSWSQKICYDLVLSSDHGGQQLLSPQLWQPL